MNPKWTSKFQLKPGKWVFVPTQESIDLGRKIKREIKSLWKPPTYYFHLRSGGHVEAIKSHLAHTSFLHIDIQDFFGSINRSRVTRWLTPMFGYAQARAYANASTVLHPDPPKRYVVPYGFVQSQIVAGLCLSRSSLGTYLDKLSKKANVAVSVYVDDIIVSSTDSKVCAQALEDLTNSADKAKLALNQEKQEGPAPIITAFNIELSNASMYVEAARLAKFIERLTAACGDAERAGIVGYVKSVNIDQVKSLPS